MFPPVVSPTKSFVATGSMVWVTESAKTVRPWKALSK